MAIAEAEFTWTRGDDIADRVYFTDANGAAIDLTGYGFAGQVRSDPDSTTVLATLTFDTAQLAAGILDYAIAKADSASFNYPSVYFDIEWTTPAGKRQTVVKFKVPVDRDTTRV